MTPAEFVARASARMACVTADLHVGDVVVESPLFLGVVTGKPVTGVVESELAGHMVVTVDDLDWGVPTGRWWLVDRPHVLTGRSV